MKRTLLLLALALVAAFAAGFFFDRSLHRPIEIRITQAEIGDSGIWPAHRSVCGAFDNICWKTT